MPTFDDAWRIGLALPETDMATTWGQLTLKVRGKSFIWERPLNGADLRRWAADTPPPDGPILAAYVADLDVKDLVLAQDPDALFTISHFDGFRAVLCRLDVVSLDRLEELITDAWLVRAPAALARQFLSR